MSRLATGIGICSALLAAAVCSLAGGVAGSAIAGGVSVAEVSDASPDVAGVSSEDLGGSPTGVESLSPGPKGSTKGGPIKSDQTKSDQTKSDQTKSDQVSARQAVERGEVRPFGWLLKKLKAAVPGDVVRVRLKHRAKRFWTYEVTVLNASGRYVVVSLNAATGTIISSKYR